MAAAPNPFKILTTISRIKKLSNAKYEAYPKADESAAAINSHFRSIPLSERLAMSEFTTTPLNELTAINTPKAPALIPKSSVKYRGKYGIVIDIPIPIISMQTTNTRYPLIANSLFNRVSSYNSSFIPFSWLLWQKKTGLKNGAPNPFIYFLELNQVNNFTIRMRALPEMQFRQALI